MQQKYVYSFNGIKAFFQTLTLTTSLPSTKRIMPYHFPNQLFVWRNKFTDGYKVSQAYQQ